MASDSKGDHSSLKPRTAIADGNELRKGSPTTEVTHDRGSSDRAIEEVRKPAENAPGLREDPKR